VIPHSTDVTMTLVRLRQDDVRRQFRGRRDRKPQ
jgi:hypothetical protein